MSKYIIYALQDPLTGEIRYVGKSSTGVARVARPHAAHCRAWKERLKRFGISPIVIILQRFYKTDDTDINVILNGCEIYWISEMRLRGCPLTNLTSGGDGSPNLDSSVRLSMSRKRTGRKHSAETRLKMSISHLGKKHNWNLSGDDHWTRRKPERLARKIPIDVVQEICRKYLMGGITQRQIASVYGVNHRSIGSLLKRYSPQVQVPS